VVDDGSTDGTADVARDAGATVFVLPENQGVGAARNVAAEHATGDVLLYTDADAELMPDVLDKLRVRLRDKPWIAAWVGLYTVSTRDANVVSRFKNLWIRHSYLSAAPHVDFLFGCLCALRRDLFWEVGGFDTQFHRNTGGVDIELGMRLRAAGHRICLDPELEVEHSRAFTVATLMQNDFRRASGYSRLGLHSQGAGGVAKAPRFANISTTYVTGTAITGIIVGQTALGFVFPPLWAGLGLPIAAHIAVNTRLYLYLLQHDREVAAAAPALMFASQLGAGFGVLKGMLTHLGQPADGAP
jgi:hypothetical protein